MLTRLVNRSLVENRVLKILAQDLEEEVPFARGEALVARGHRGVGGEDGVLGRLLEGAREPVPAQHLLPRALFGRAPAKLPYSALCIPPWYRGIPVPVLRLARVARVVGVATHVWTINDPAVAEALWKAGINGIITDDPQTMLDRRSQLA